MSKHSGLSDIESELMSFFWNQTTPVVFADILHFCNDEKGWNWAKTTAHTHITRLMKKGFLDMNDVRGTRRTYFAKISREDYARSLAQELADSFFSGSVKNLLLALASGSQLTPADLDELQKTLDQLAEAVDHPEH